MLCILTTGFRVKESTVFTRKYCTELTSLSLLSVFEVEIWCFRGGNEVPKWIMRQAGTPLRSAIQHFAKSFLSSEDFGTLCAVQANLSPLASSAEPKTGRNGKTYWMIVFSVEIHFGLTEFKARIKWNDSVRLFGIFIASLPLLKQLMGLGRYEVVSTVDYYFRARF